ncbi:MAG: hypothetical protein ABW042_09130 [Phenylobacterium sp.]
MNRVPSADIFAALANELQVAGELCTLLESVVARLVRGDSLVSRESAMRDAQAVDALAQHLQGLASFTEALSLADQAGGEFEVAAALRTITLAAMAGRLGSEMGQVQLTESAGHEEGELQLF